MSGLMETLLVTTGEPFPDMLEAVSTLRDSGLKTALLTNNWYSDDVELATNQTTIAKSLGPLFDVVRQCLKLPVTFMLACYLVPRNKLFCLSAIGITWMQDKQLLNLSTLLVSSQCALLESVIIATGAMTH